MTALLQEPDACYAVEPLPYAVSDLVTTGPRDAESGWYARRGARSGRNVGSAEIHRSAPATRADDKDESSHDPVSATREPSRDQQMAWLIIRSVYLKRILTSLSRIQAFAGSRGA